MKNKSYNNSSTINKEGVTINNLKALREKRHISQIELSKILGVSQGAVSQWENGQSMPRAEMLPKIAKVLGCTVDELLEQEEES